MLASPRSCFEPGKHLHAPEWFDQIVVGALYTASVDQRLVEAQLILEALIGQTKLM